MQPFVRLLNQSSSIVIALAMLSCSASDVQSTAEDSAGAGGSAASAGDAAGGDIAANPSAGGATSSGGTSGAGGQSSTAGSGGQKAAAGSGGSAPAGDAGKAPVPTPGNAPMLKPGVWTNISPPTQLNYTNDYPTVGTTGLALDPSNPWTIYVGVEISGLWRSTDGGSSWKNLGHGPDSNPYDTTTTFLDMPIIIEIDPGDSKHIYATEGVRGHDNGFWVSHDGGESWLRPPGFMSVATNTDITTMAVDPTDFNHVLLCFHSGPADIMESKDGGTTWKLLKSPAGWPGGTFSLAFLYDPAHGRTDTNTWLVHHDSFWRTTDAGHNWTKVSDISGVHGTTEIYYTKDGTLYSGGYNLPARSKDNGLTWERLTNGVPPAVYYSVIGDGNSLYMIPDLGPGQTPQLTITAPESDGTKWTSYKGGAQTFKRGPLYMRFDAANRILYSANWEAGVFALKVDP